MTVPEMQRVSVEDFDAFVERPENSDRNFEYIGGEIVEVVSKFYAAEIAQAIAVYIGMFLIQNRIGRMTGADGGYMVAGERYIPDVGFISMDKQPEPLNDAYSPNPPDLAVEVVSDETSSKELRDLTIKISNYLSVGTLVWIVYPDAKVVHVHQTDHAVRILSIDDTLDGGAVLPDFTLAIKDIFRD